jgi:winged helix-turn-helix DNA-binding protein
MADFLTDQLAAIDKRLKELRPLHDEYLKLEQAKEALAGVGSPRRGPGRPPGSKNRRGPGRPRGSRRKPANGRRRRRGRRGGTRADQALKAVQANPGITVSELGKKIGIKQPNYLYRVMAGLQKDGSVKKRGKGYVAA